MNKFTRFIINDDEWIIYIVPDDDKVIQDEDAAAVTEFDQREIFFRESYITDKIVRHELWHVHKGYCYIGTADIDKLITEEISAELFADRGPHILKQATELYNILLKMKVEKNEDEN